MEDKQSLEAKLENAINEHQQASNQLAEMSTKHSNLQVRRDQIFAPWQFLGLWRHTIHLCCMAPLFGNMLYKQGALL
jgi:hypothetical protein